MSVPPEKEMVLGRNDEGVEEIHTKNNIVLLFSILF
jgi:hypothetical protein